MSAFMLSKKEYPVAFFVSITAVYSHQNVTTDIQLLVCHRARCKLTRENPQAPQKEKKETDLPRLPLSKNISKTSKEKRQTKPSTTQIYINA
jgi:hypothetical protein